MQYETHKKVVECDNCGITTYLEKAKIDGWILQIIPEGFEIEKDFCSKECKEDFKKKFSTPKIFREN